MGRAGMGRALSLGKGMKALGHARLETTGDKH